MFNTYINKGTEYIPYEKEVREIKAPTDDSIRLYQEIKEKAYKDILYSIERHDNEFNFNAIVYKDHISYSTVCSYVFTLNGKKIEGDIELQRVTLRASESKQEVIKKIIEHASLTIASYLAPKIWNEKEM